MPGFKCYFCDMMFAESYLSFQSQFPSFQNANGKRTGHIPPYDNSCIEIQFYRCPNCGKYTVLAVGRGTDVSEINTILQPSSRARQFPDYISKTIREDYEEACAIVDLSPKASATLSRRCLQGMIRDYWKIEDESLYKEIGNLKGKVDETLWPVLDSVRRIGNIGAHPEKDVNCIIEINPTDAQKLISVIELLMQEWYIARNNREKLYQGVLQISEEVQVQRDTNAKK